MTNILLLEDVPEASAWLKVQVSEVFAEPVFFEASRVNGALAIIAKEQIDVALIDLGLPDGSGVDVVVALREAQPKAQAVVVTIHDDDDHLFPALQAGAFGYVLKDQSEAVIVDQFRRMSQGEPPLSPAIARRVMSHFATRSQQRGRPRGMPHVVLTDRENEVLLRFLIDHVRDPVFQCRFRWDLHSIAFWDNRSVQHYAVPDYAERRVMHRVTLAGDRPR